jgi:hypothetical protein
MSAWALYMAGGFFALKVAVSGLSDASLYAGIAGIAFAVATWWIAAGIAIRLGVTPDDFIASIVSSLGFRQDHGEDVEAGKSLTDPR